MHQMPQWQGAAGLDLAERKTGVQVFHVGQVDQVLQGKLAEGFEVLRHHLQLKGAGAADD